MFTLLEFLSDSVSHLFFIINICNVFIYVCIYNVFIMVFVSLKYSQELPKCFRGHVSNMSFEQEFQGLFHTQPVTYSILSIQYPYLSFLEKVNIKRSPLSKVELFFILH